MGRGDFFEDERIPTREERIEYLNRFIDQLKADLTRVTAERDRLVKRGPTPPSGCSCHHNNPHNGYIGPWSGYCEVTGCRCNCLGY